MIPLFATISMDRAWIPIPLFLVWLLILPLAIVAMPIFIMACLAFRLNPFQVLSATWQILAALGKTDIALQRAETSFRLQIK